MISHEDMMGIIATEAIEALPVKPLESEKDLPTIEYDLRLVRKEDGTLEWRD